MDGLVVKHILCFLVSFCGSYALIPLFLKKAVEIGFLDRPDGVIKNHQKPIPYMGGIAVYAGFISALIFVLPYSSMPWWLLLGTATLMLVGLIDDVKILRPGRKLLGQCIAVTCFLHGGLLLKTHYLSSYFTLALSIFWMLLVINAFNLIDIMDGLSSLVALISGSAFFTLALLFGQYQVSLLMLAFIGPLFAFFLYNKPPARIYLGDAGALFIGGFLAAVPLLIPWGSSAPYAYCASIVILAIPLLEVFFLVLIRTRLGIPFYLGSPHHFALYLQRKGWSKQVILVFIGVVGIVLSSVAIVFACNYITMKLFIILGLLFFVAWSVIIFSSLFTKCLDKEEKKTTMTPPMNYKNNHEPLVAKGKR